MTNKVIADDGHTIIFRCQQCLCRTDLRYKSLSDLHKVLYAPCERCGAQGALNRVNEAYRSF